MLIQNLSLFILRIVFGLLFFGHGAQKLFGWFGGGGIEGTSRMATHLGVWPPKFWAWVVGLSETLGGLALAFGFVTPFAGAVIVGVMLMAILKVHWRNGLWNTNRGIELPLLNALLAAFFGIAGPGSYAVDAMLGFDKSTGITFLLSLILVFLGLVISLISGQLVQESSQNQSPQHG
ncbi:MAG: DoxX family protein [Anaerolineales bacterium]